MSGRRSNVLRGLGLCLWQASQQFRRSKYRDRCASKVATIAGDDRIEPNGQHSGPAHTQSRFGAPQLRTAREPERDPGVHSCRAAHASLVLFHQRLEADAVDIVVAKRLTNGVECTVTPSAARGWSVAEFRAGSLGPSLRTPFTGSTLIVHRQAAALPLIALQRAARQI